jgi:thioredoxin-like negative regulator of GroEL
MSIDDGADTRAAIRAAETLYKEGQLQDSAAAFNALLRTDQRAAALYGLGRISFSQKNFSRAQALFEQSLGVERRNANTLFYLGQTLLARGSADQAIAFFEEAIAYRPDHESTRRALSSLTAAGHAGHDDSSSTAAPRQETKPALRATSAPPQNESKRPDGTPSQSPGNQNVGSVPLSPSGPGMLVGHAQRVQKQQQLTGKGSIQTLEFRLEPPDSQALVVQMRGVVLEGVVSDGDVIEVERARVRGGWLETDHVYNRTNHSDVRMRQGFSGAVSLTKAKWGRKWIIALIIIPLVLVALFIGWIFFMIHQGDNWQREHGFSSSPQRTTPALVESPTGAGASTLAAALPTATRPAAAVFLSTHSVTVSIQGGRR